MTLVFDPAGVKERFKKLPKWVQGLAYWLDRRLNAKYGGNPEETVSYRLAKARNEGKWEGQVGCGILDGLDPGHCDGALRNPHGG